MEITQKEPQGSQQYPALLQHLIGTSVPLSHLIPRTKENHFFYKNGLSKIIPRVQVKVVSEIEDCQKIWELFSSNETLYDLWKVRYSFYQGYQFKPHFLTLFEGNKILASMPLWYDADEKRYTWFGSWWMENNQVFTVDDKFLDVMYAIAPTPIFLNAIDVKSNWTTSRFFNQFVTDDPKNVKDLSGITSIDDFMQTLKKKERYNLKADYLKIQELNPQISILNSYDETLFDEMIELNKRRHDGSHGEMSDFYDEKSVECIRQLIKNQSGYQIKIVVVKIQNHIAAVDLLVEYNNIYYMIVGGCDMNRFRGISNFLMYYEFNDAIERKFASIDCMQIDYGWKHRFFDQSPVYKVDIK